MTKDINKDGEILRLKKEIERLKKSIKNQRYGLVWMDVPEAFEDDVENKLPILKEVSKLEIKSNDDKPQHILVEGDNYHTLTCLNYTHKGKIDVIYIDPPYNTGSDGFKYKDKRILSKYPDGTPVPKESPFRHSYWLSFMGKRLELAKSLLKDRGVIFISIDHNELAQLKLLCDSIFTEDNFVGTLIWRKKEGGGQADAYFVTEHEYILVYAKSNKFRWMDEIVSADEAKYNKKDNNGKFTAVKLAKWGNTARREDRPKMYFPIKSPDEKNVYPIAPDGGDGRWRVGKKRMEMLIRDNLIYWEKKNGKYIPYEKIYFTGEEIKKIKERSILFDLANTADGTNELTEIFGIKDKLQNPKPTDLIKFLINYTCPKSGVVLDFFAGSGTTGHSVLRLNEEDDGSRQFILATNNDEVTNGEKHKIMTDICYPRIKKVLKDFGGSAKYYKTDFVGKNNILFADDKDKTELAHNAGELLAIAENTLNLIKANNYYQIFRSKNKDKHTAVYFREELDQFDKFIEDVLSIDGKITVYLFSWEDNEEIEEFEERKNIKIKTIPRPILEIYKQIYNLV